METKNQELVKGNLNTKMLCLFFVVCASVLFLSLWTSMVHHESASPEQAFGPQSTKNLDAHYGQAVLQQLHHDAERSTGAAITSDLAPSSFERHFTALQPFFKDEDPQAQHASATDTSDTAPMAVLPPSDLTADPSEKKSAALENSTTLPVPSSQLHQALEKTQSPVPPSPQAQQYSQAQDAHTIPSTLPESTMLTTPALAHSETAVHSAEAETFSDQGPSAYEQYRNDVVAQRATALWQARHAPTSIPNLQPQHLSQQHSASSEEERLEYDLAQSKATLDRLNALPLQGQGEGYNHSHLVSLPASGQDQHTLNAYDSLSQNDFRLQSRLEDPISPFTLLQGSIIPCVLLTGINSDIPGQVQAQVTAPVYDSTTGQHLLIPQGARVIGQYAASPAYGQRRLMLAFNRILFPNGQSLNLGAMPGASSDGYAGFETEVDQHFWRIFGQSLLLGGITASVSLSTDSVTNEHGELTVNGALSQSLGQSLGRAMTQMIERNLALSPTLNVRPGFTFSVTLTKDISFDHAYRIVF